MHPKPTNSQQTQGQKKQARIGGALDVESSP
jgi:hypothetical protein